MAAEQREWRVTLPDGTKGAAQAWTDTGQLIIRHDPPCGCLLHCWPEELTTDTGKPLGIGFAAGLPTQGDDT
jgi:hypothetical protein